MISFECSGSKAQVSSDDAPHFEYTVTVVVERSDGKPISERQAETATTRLMERLRQ